MTKNKSNKQAKMPKAKKQQPRFSDVSTVRTAPVAIGNSIRGSKPIVTNSVNGARIVGRDFAFELKSTVAAATTWSCIGGMPITPAVLATSSLRSYTQMFSVFKINRLAFHYITSSPTSQAGDVLFYYERERVSPMIDWTNSSFLPFVLSDPSTILGPQWQNHTVNVRPVPEFKSTNFGLSTDLNEEACGSIIAFSKTNAANSPGYMLVDFDITFKEMCINPRAGILPISRGLFNYVTLGRTAAVTVAATTQLRALVQGVNPDGTASAMPNGAANGDVYKCFAMLTNSTVGGTNSAWVVATAANLAQYQTSGITTNITVDDGFTFYIQYQNSSDFALFPTLESAKVNTGNNLYYGVTGTVTWNLCCMITYVGSNNTNLQSSY